MSEEKKKDYSAMTAAELARCSWTEIGAAEAAAAIVEIFFETYTGPQPLGTLKLVRLAAPDLPPNCFKGFFNRLQAARDYGMLEGYFDRGRKGPYGAPLVLWHRYIKPE
ncbi:MAG: hypothetical protein KGJ13_09155 [Patescibacteria group bacterium]|nr:hypothetical protein [Patescibacteria group bacterium]